MTTVAYYIPNIPQNKSTTRYNHAYALPDFSKNTALITYDQNVARDIIRRYDKIFILDNKNFYLRTLEAKNYAEQFLDSQRSPENIFITTFHPSPALSGLLSKHYWVIDVFDSPHQLYYNNRNLRYRTLVFILTLILDKADRGVHTVHPGTPETFGDDVYYATNGAPFNNIYPNIQNNERKFLRGVCAGMKGDMTCILQAISNGSINIKLDVYGTVSASDKNLTSELNLDKHVTYHGSQPHDIVVEAIEQADVGFCILPQRPDWRYANPIRIGEYLAGGTIPIISPLPGSRELIRDAGICIRYDDSNLSKVLVALSNNIKLRTALQERARRRAKEIRWSRERSWFAKQAIFGENSWKYR